MYYAARAISFFCCLLLYSLLGAQTTYKLSGVVIGDDLKPLQGASIYVARFSSGTFSDSTGHFQLVLASGWNEVSVSYVGYGAEKLNIYLNHDTAVSIMLRTDLQLAEVAITERKQMLNALHDASGVITLTKQNFNSLPAFLGENDPVRAIQMQPGVQSGNEGARGIFIRGGSPDQNLILLDGAPVYNPSHVYGFISVFNGDAIDKIEVYKDRYPSRYGGRLCSVIDIGVSDGDTAKLNGTFSLGLVTSRLNLNGPLTKDKRTTFSVSLRGCYIGLFTAPISSRQYKATGFSGSISYYFADVNAKIVHRFSAKTKLAINFFANNDFYSFKRSFSSATTTYTENGLVQNDISWANYVASAAVVHSFNSRWQMKHQFSFSRYQITTRDKDNYRQTRATYDYYNYNNADTRSYINDIAYRADGTYTTGQQTFTMGAAVTGRFFETGKGNYGNNNVSSGANVYRLNGSLYKTIDAGLYAEDQYHPNEYWLISGGFYANIYNVQGRTFGSLLPRVSVLYNPVAKFYLRASASGLTQNMHLLATASSNILNDYWVPATTAAKPETGWNFSGGMMHKLPLNFEWSVDGFYRLMNNVLEYNNSKSQSSIYQPWEEQVLTGGKGRSYGAEFYVARTKGRVTGSVSYTLSWSERKFESLNEGKFFPYKYDRRHNLAAQMVFLVGRHFELGVAYVYGSGNRLSLPVQSYHTFNGINYYDYTVAIGQGSGNQNDVVTIYGGRNNARLPSYQHLDVSFTYRKRIKRLEHAFNFSVYNVYNHYNIFAVYADYRSNPDGSRSIVYKKLSLFPVLPSLSYTIKFA